MPAPYSQDLRNRVLAAYDRGKTTKQITETLGVSPAWARRVKQVRREEKRVERLPMGGARVSKIDMDRLRELVKLQPDATIPELHERLGKQSCSESAVGAALIRLGLTFKKRRFMLRNRTGPMSRSNAASGGSGNRQTRIPSDG